MKKLNFKTKNGTMASSLGAGCYPYNNVAYGSCPREESITTMIEIYKQGINFFDVANCYGLVKSKAPAEDDGWGESESRLSEVIREVGRDNLFIASKGGRYRGSSPDGHSFDIKPGGRIFDPDYIEDCFYESCKRLGIEYMDLYQLHGPYFDERDKEQVVECIFRLNKLKEKGLIGYVGVSLDKASEGIAMLKENLQIDSFQMIYHILEKHTVKELFNLVKEKGVRIIAREPLMRGFLTGKDGKYKSEMWGNDFSLAVKKNIGKIAKKLGRDPKSTDDLKYAYEYMIKEVNKVVKIFKDHGRNESLTQLALKFCLMNPVITTTITGIKKPEYIADSLGTLNIPDFSPELLADLDKLKDIEK